MRLSGTFSSTSRPLSHVSCVGLLGSEGCAGGFTSRGGEVILLGEEYSDSLGAFGRRSLEAAERLSRVKEEMIKIVLVRKNEKNPLSSKQRTKWPT